MPLALRVATRADAGAVSALVNAAFRVEDFFKAGDRTDEQEVAALLDSGEFLLLEDEGPAAGSRPAACVYLERNGARAYFGMLSIDPARQGSGLGRLLLESLEARCRAAGCREIEIHVVNLRQELFAFYRRFGYVETGTLPFPDDGSSTRPCHFVVMIKRLS
jgi:GNAT superfamily N-acetyltransferase